MFAPDFSRRAADCCIIFEVRRGRSLRFFGN
jgi:hypothetical protein